MCPKCHNRLSFCNRRAVGTLTTAFGIRPVRPKSTQPLAQADSFLGPQPMQFLSVVLASAKSAPVANMRRNSTTPDYRVM